MISMISGFAEERIFGKFSAVIPPARMTGFWAHFFILRKKLILIGVPFLAALDGPRLSARIASTAVELRSLTHSSSSSVPKQASRSDGEKGSVLMTPMPNCFNVLAIYSVSVNVSR